MSALAILALAWTLQAPPADPATLGDEGREIFRLERESAAGRTQPSPDAPGPTKTAARSPALRTPYDTFDPAQTDAMRGDAWLHEVCFVDAKHGWAVGDRGAICHTDDGGRNWQRQDSGVACPLCSVCFLDARTGWAAGGFSHPYLHDSSGVVLATRDGGRHWYRNPGLLLPGLKQIRFFDARSGWAAGNSSPLFPSGVFATHDGGRSWTPLCGGNADGWTTGDFFDAHTGILAGRNAATAAVRQGDLEPARAGTLDLQTLRQLRLVVPPYAWLVGDGGAVLFTSDLGGHWRGLPPSFPRDTAAMFDFAALAVRGPKCWIAGTPGSRVLHSPDGGRTWSAFPTPTRLPLSSMTFVDDEHGWAVGAMGTILATEDGGRTWRRQQGGGARAAMLGLFCHEDDVPLELAARLAGNEGYLSVIDVLGRRDLEIAARDEAPREDRIHEAVVSVGGCGAETAWQFPLRQAGLRLSTAAVIDCWDRFHGGRGLQELESHLVRQIRIWRPEIVVTNLAGPTGDDAAEQLIAQVVAGAIRKAGDPRAFPDQIALAGLEPWQVKRAYGSMPPGTRGAIELMTAQLAPRLGRSLADVAAPGPGSAGGPLSRRPSPRWGSGRCWRRRRRSKAADFFAGAALVPGSDARRQLIEATAEGSDLPRRIAERRRHMQAILDQADRDPQAAVRLLAQAGDLTRGLDAASAAGILYRLGDRYALTGHGDLAAEAFQLLVDQYPDDPLCRPALVWLVQYYVSDEAAERAGGDLAAGGPAHGRKRLDRAVATAMRIQRDYPDLFAHPAVRFPLAAAYRKQGLPQQAQRLYLMQGRGGKGDAWSACAGRNLVGPVERRPAQTDAGLRDRRDQAAIGRPAGRRRLATGQAGRLCRAACTTMRSGRPPSCSPTTTSFSTSRFVAAWPPGRGMNRPAVRASATPILRPTTASMC